MHSFAPFFGPSFVLFGDHSFALFCAYLRSFALICVFLRPTAFRTTAFGNCRNPSFPGNADSGRCLGSGKIFYGLFPELTLTVIPTARRPRERGVARRFQNF